jgi:cobalt-zinc-cadmium efflux system outer membrane protein
MFRYFLFVCLPVLSCAAEISLTLPQVPAYAVRNHPNLAAARWRIEEARGRLLGAGRLANPNFNTEIAPNIKGRENWMDISFQQSFPLTDRLRLEKKLSGYEVAVAEEEVREQERRIAAEAESAAVQVLVLDAQAQLRQRQKALAQELTEFVSKRVSAGELSSLDAGQAQTEAAQISLDLRQLAAEQVSAMNALRAALGIAPGNTVKLRGSLPAPQSVRAQASLKQRPDYRMAELQQQAADTNADLARARRVEDISIAPFVQNQRMEDAPNGIENDVFVGLRLSIPLPFWNRNQGAIAEAAARRNRAAAETQALALTIRNEVAAAQRDMQMQAQMVDETKNQLLPLVEQQVERLQQAYQAGQSDLMVLLRARDQRLRLEVAALTATREWHLARIRLRAAQGQPQPPSSSK